LESFPFSSFRRLRVAAVAEPSPGCLPFRVGRRRAAYLCSRRQAVWQPSLWQPSLGCLPVRVSRRLAVAGLLTCAAAARLRDNRHRGSRRRAACRFTSAVAWLHRWPSPGCSPLCSRREAARQSSLGCVTTVSVAAIAGLLVGSCQPSPGRRWAAYVCINRQAAWQPSLWQPSPGCLPVRVSHRLAVAGLLTCAAAPRPRDNRHRVSRRLAVAGLLTCAAVARLRNNRHRGSRRRAACRFVSAVAWPSQGCLPVQPSPGCVTTVSVAAIAGLLAGSCQPSPGRRWAAYLCSRRQAAWQPSLCQPSPGCLSVRVSRCLAVAGLLTCAAAARLYDNRRCGSRRRAACRFVSAIVWPSPGCSPLCSRHLCSRRQAAWQPSSW